MGSSVVQLFIVLILLTSACRVLAFEFFNLKSLFFPTNFKPYPMQRVQHKEQRQGELFPSDFYNQISNNIHVIDPKPPHMDTPSAMTGGHPPSGSYGYMHPQGHQASPGSPGGAGSMHHPGQQPPPGNIGAMHPAGQQPSSGNYGYMHPQGHQSFPSATGSLHPPGQQLHPGGSGSMHPPGHPGTGSMQPSGQHPPPGSYGYMHPQGHKPSTGITGPMHPLGLQHPPGSYGYMHPQGHPNTMHAPGQHVSGSAGSMHPPGAPGAMMHPPGAAMHPSQALDCGPMAGAMHPPGQQPSPGSAGSMHHPPGGAGSMHPPSGGAGSMHPPLGGAGSMHPPSGGAGSMHPPPGGAGSMHPPSGGAGSMHPPSGGAGAVHPPGQYPASVGNRPMRRPYRRRGRSVQSSQSGSGPMHHPSGGAGSMHLPGHYPPSSGAMPMHPPGSHEQGAAGPMHPPGSHPQGAAGPMHPPGARMAQGMHGATTPAAGGHAAGQGIHGAMAANCTIKPTPMPRPTVSPRLRDNMDVTDENLFLFVAMSIAAILAKARGVDVTFSGPVVGKRSVDNGINANYDMDVEILMKGLLLESTDNPITNTCTQRAACEVPNDAELLTVVLDIMAWISGFGYDWMNVNEKLVAKITDRLQQGAQHGYSLTDCDDLFPCPQLAICPNCTEKI